MLFIATAKLLGTIHPALGDRMEILQLSGNSQTEKEHSARMPLIPPCQLAEHGLTADQITITDDALQLVIAEHTQEAGVQGLEHQIGTFARKVAAAVTTRSTDVPPGPTTVVNRVGVEEFLGPPRFRREIEFCTSRPGVGPASRGPRPGATCSSSRPPCFQAESSR